MSDSRKESGCGTPPHPFNETQDVQEPVKSIMKTKKSSSDEIKIQTVSSTSRAAFITISK